MQKGDKLFVTIEGKDPWFLGEVVQENPLVIKIAEKGPLASLKPGDFTVLERETAMLRENGAELQQLLHEQFVNGRPVQTGLAGYGRPAKKNKLRSVLAHADEAAVRGVHFKLMTGARLRGESYRRRR